MKDNLWRRLAHSAVALLFLFALAAALQAQAAPTAQPTYTRIVGSDTLDMGNPVTSPDGRWVAFSVLHTPEESSIWIVPAAGGTPSRLTTRGHFDGAPAWMPSGDRIVFPSNRPARGEAKMFGMVLPIDPSTGKATAQPRQLTLDVTFRGLLPSPDGRAVLYVTREDDKFKLKAIPSAGGNARLILETDRQIWAATWSSDGRSIYYSTRPLGTEDRVIMQVAAAGGTPREMYRVTQVVRAIAPTGHVLTTEGGGGWPQRMTLHDPRGRVVAVMPIEGRKRPVGFTPDGRGVLLLENQTTAAIRIVPVQGGPFRALTSGDDYDWTLGWTPNGSAVIAETRVSDRRALVIAPADGGQARTIEMPFQDVGTSFFATAGNAVALAVPTAASDAYRLVAVDLNDQRHTVISENVLRGPGVGVYGPGGEWREGDRFLYAERKRDLVEIRSARTAGDSRLIRSFPMETLGRSVYAVHGGRVAWWTVRGDSSFLMVAEGASGTPRAIAASRGTAMAELAWSWDGKRIASHWPADRDRSMARIMVVEVPQTSQRATPRLIETGAMYFYWPKWLPDDSGLLMVAGFGMGVQSHILHVPIREGDAPVVVTRDDPAGKWGFELSPDGRTIAYPGEIPGGTAIWRADLASAIATR